MLNRVLAWALAAAVFLGVGGYTLVSLNDRSVRLAAVSRDVCYARDGVDQNKADSAPAQVKANCTLPVRDYDSGWIWRCIFAAAAGATAALLVVGGIVIVLRARAQAAEPPGGSGS